MIHLKPPPRLALSAINSENFGLATKAQNLAKEMDITDMAAKRIMAEGFEAAEGASLYEWGKELDEEFYRPQIEAEKREREAAKDRPRKRSFARSGPR